MKKMFILFSFFWVLGISLSCSDENIPETSVMLSTQTKSLERDCASYYVNPEGVLCFETVQDFFALSDSLSRLSGVELRNWETEIGFKSYRSISDEIISEIYASEGTPNFKAVINKYSDFVYMDSDSIIRSHILGVAYQNICNKDGIYYVENTKNCIVNNQVSAEGTNSQKVGTRAVGDVLVEYPAMAYSPASDKRVDTFARLYEVAAIGLGGTTSRLQLDIEVRGYSKNFLGVWKKYETECFLDDLTIETPEYGNQVYFGTRSSNGDYVSFTFTFSLYANAVSQPRPPFHKPTCLHYRARTRGTGNYGMAYNFINGVFFNVSESTPSNPGCGKHSLITYYK